MGLLVSPMYTHIYKMRIVNAKTMKHGKSLQIADVLCWIVEQCKKKK